MCGLGYSLVEGLNPNPDLGECRQIGVIFNQAQHLGEMIAKLRRPYGGVTAYNQGIIVNIGSLAVN
jgi:hypothetical protein